MFSSKYFNIKTTVMSILLAGLVFSACSREQILTVKTQNVERRTISQKVSAIGRINPETEVKISPETSGEIIYLGIEEGDTVSANQLLVKIKPDIIQTRLDQYKAGLDASKMEIEMRKAEMERSKSELSRITELYKKEFASKSDFERAESTYQTALAAYKSSLSGLERSEAAYREIERNAERTAIFAPIAGTVTKLAVEKGEKVVGTEMMQGTEMLRVSDLSVMNAVVDIDENDIVLVDIGDTAYVEVDAFPNKKFLGQVIEIGHSAQVSSLGSQDQVTNFSVKVRLLEKDVKMRPGMSCNVEINTQTKYNVLSVPLQAVTVRIDKREQNETEQKSNQFKTEEAVEKSDIPPSLVFVVSGDSVKQTVVETGVSDSGFIEIVSGLSDKQEIVTGNFTAVSKLLEDGSKIKKEKDAKTKE
jgi:HlyD family secretion protein